MRPRRPTAACFVARFAAASSSIARPRRALAASRGGAPGASTPTRPSAASRAAHLGPRGAVRGAAPGARTRAPPPRAGAGARAGSWPQNQRVR